VNLNIKTSVVWRVHGADVVISMLSTHAPNREKSSAERNVAIVEDELRPAKRRLDKHYSISGTILLHDELLSSFLTATG
jgi:hypothetical protein